MVCQVWQSTFQKKIGHNLCIHLKQLENKKEIECNPNMSISDSSNNILHNEENPFLCNECGKSFAVEGDLVNHLKAHTGEKLVQCNYCEIWFTQEGNLDQQQTIHAVEKPNHTIYCDKCLNDNRLGCLETTEKKFKRYSSEEKDKIADLVEKYKDEYDKEVAENKKLPKHWNPKLKKFCVLQVKGGYIARAVRELYPTLANINNDHPDFQRALNVARRALESRQNKRKNGDVISTGSKYKSRAPGGGRKLEALEFRQAVFDWFVDIRGTLKGSLPTKIFKAKCEELYDIWLVSHAKDLKIELKFSRQWTKDWMKEYNVSLSSPNKRFAISQENRVLRITEFLKNVMKVRYYFQVHFKKEPVIISGDQMPLHRNDITSKKTMIQNKLAVYEMENNTLSRERASVYTQLSTEPQHTMPTPEVLFKGEDVGTQMNSSLHMSFQFASKGSYRLENMMRTIKTLKNRNHMHSQKDYAIYILDDYSVHMQDEVREYLLQQGYVLVIVGGGITGDVQINEAHLHPQLKTKYREKESELMLQKLNADPNSIPTPSRNEMMQMLYESWRTINIDPVTALKNNFVLNALDGSEDHLISDNLMEIVGEEIKAFRKELLSSSPPHSIDELIRTITPPRGVKIKRKTDHNIPPDEGRELMDCEGDEIPFEEGDHAPIALVSPPTAAMINEKTTNTSDCINKEDSKFLKEIAEVLHKHTGQTSNLILPYYSRFQDTVKKARCSLKKCDQ